MTRLAWITFIAVSTLSFQLTPLSRIKMGKAPTFVDMSPDGSRLFISNYGSDEIKVVDTASAKTVGAFYAGYEPLGIAVLPTGEKIFVTNMSNGLVKAVRSQDYEILDDIKVGGGPSNIVIAPNGMQAFVTNFGRGKFGKVDFIDTSTHRILGEVEVGIRPIAAAVSTFGDQLFVVCGGSNDLYVIDTATRNIIKQLPVGIAPDGIALAPDGSTLYVANSVTNDLSVIDLIELEETRRVSVGNKPFSIAVDPEGRIYVVETGDNAVSVYGPDFQKLGSVKVGKKPTDIQLSADSKFAYVTAERSNRLYVLSIR